MTLETIISDVVLGTISGVALWQQRNHAAAIAETKQVVADHDGQLKQLTPPPQPNPDQIAAMVCRYAPPTHRTKRK